MQHFCHLITEKYALASSINLNDESHYGANFAIDGKLSSSHIGCFQSQAMHHPWHMTIFNHIITLTGIKIHRKYDSDSGSFNNIDVRAGKIAIPDNYSGNITQNELCGTFVGPGVSDNVIKVSCGTPIKANVVTLQMMDQGDQTLQLDEVEFIEDGLLELNLLKNTLLSYSISIGFQYL